MNEQWKPVKGYEGLYEVSEIGTVRSFEKKWITGRGKGTLHIQKANTVKSFITRFGYERISLWRDAKPKKFHVHRLVAFAFNNGFFEGAHVNHIDGNKLNNHFSNLEWVTPSDNIFHAFNTGLKSISEKTKSAIVKSHSGGNNNTSRLVIDYQTGIYYETIKEAAEAKGYKVWNLHAYLQGRNKNKSSLNYA